MSENARNVPGHLLTVEELAAFLSVPKSWVYSRTGQGGIPHVRVGRYVRFKAGEVLRWLDGEQRGVAATR